MELDGIPCSSHGSWVSHNNIMNLTTQLIHKICKMCDDELYSYTDM